MCSKLICPQTEDVECMKFYKCLPTLDTFTTTYVQTNLRTFISTKSGRERKIYVAGFYQIANVTPR